MAFRILISLLASAWLLCAQPPGVRVGAGLPVANPQPMLKLQADLALPEDAERHGFGLAAELKYKRGWQHVIKPTFSARHERYAFDLGPDLGVDGVDRATHVDLGLAYLHFTPAGWSFFSKAELGFAAEDEDALTDDPVPHLILGLGRQFKNRNKIGLALIAKRDVEEDWRVFPVPNLELHLTDHWTLTTERAILLQRDVGAPTSFALGVDYLNSRFRTEADTILEYNAAPLFLQATHTASRNLTLTARLGAIVWGELELDNADGRGLRDEDLDPGFHAAFHARYSFP